MTFNTLVSLLVIASAISAKGVFTTTSTIESNIVDTSSQESNEKGIEESQHSTEVKNLLSAEGSTPSTDESTPQVKTMAYIGDIIHDYDINWSEPNSTEPPNMEPLATLVDENGNEDMGEKGSEDKILKSMSISKNHTSKAKDQIRGKKTNEMIKKIEKKRRKRFKRLKHLISRLVKGNYTEKQLDFCLAYYPDSGFWCEGTVGKLNVRYYYDREGQTCECFLYYGCLGNLNNFETLEGCQKLCRVFGLKTEYKTDKRFKRWRHLVSNDNKCQINP